MNVRRGLRAGTKALAKPRAAVKPRGTRLILRIFYFAGASTIAWKTCLPFSTRMMPIGFSASCVALIVVVPVTPGISFVAAMAAVIFSGSVLFAFFIAL